MSFRSTSVSVGTVGNHAREKTGILGRGVASFVCLTLHQLSFPLYLLFNVSGFPAFFSPLPAPHSPFPMCSNSTGSTAEFESAVGSSVDCIISGGMNAESGDVCSES